MSDDAEIRAILELQREIALKKAQVSTRLNIICEREKAAGNQDKLLFNVDGDIWELARWVETPHNVAEFKAWCLRRIGKTL